jgi:hypothetical protein
MGQTRNFIFDIQSKKEMNPNMIAMCRATIGLVKLEFLLGRPGLSPEQPQ